MTKRSVKCYGEGGASHRPGAGGDPRTPLKGIEKIAFLRLSKHTYKDRAQNEYHP